MKKSEIAKCQSRWEFLDLYSRDYPNNPMWKFEKWFGKIQEARKQKNECGNKIGV